MADSAALFAPAKQVHFALEDDGDDSGDSSSLFDTARSSPVPPPPQSNDARPYSDDVDDAPTPSTSSHRHNDSLSYYPPVPTKSTTASRESAYDLDSDDLDDDADETMEELDEPLLEGLLQTAGAKRTTDASHKPTSSNLEAGDSDEPPDWLTKGAGVLAGIANMSNSILGAGIVGEPFRLKNLGGRLEAPRLTSVVCHRTTLCTARSWIRHGDPAAAHPRRRYRLDDPVDRA